MSDDLISRQAAIDAVDFEITYVHAINIETGEETDLSATANYKLEKAITRIKNLPSAERRGRWFIKKDVTFPHMVCSECKKPFYGNMNDTWNYCPYCGARMMD